MKRWFRLGINNASLILSLLGVILGIVGYVLNHFIPDEYEFEAWVMTTLILITNGVMLGRMIKSLAVDATIDSLTGLGNKGLFYYFMKIELSKYKKITQFTESPYLFSLAMIDIDNFKKLNDTYGHVAGDHVLKQIAQILEESARSSDYIVRWGGEEFAIILPETDSEGGLTFLDRIRDIIANSNFGHEAEFQQVTISAGIVSTKDLNLIEAGDKSDDEVINDIVQLADQALYQAKLTKNRVIRHSIS